jgi:hypothetical protein
MHAIAELESEAERGGVHATRVIVNTDGFDVSTDALRDELFTVNADYFDHGGGVGSFTRLDAVIYQLGQCMDGIAVPRVPHGFDSEVLRNDFV